MRTWLLSIALVACGAPRDPVPHNVAGGTAVRIGPTDPLGWLAVATSTKDDDALPIYVPVSTEHPVITLAERDALPATLSAIGAAGGVVPLTRGPLVKIRYGCETNELGVTALAGARMPPALVWLLPPSRPASWQPVGLPILSKTSAPAQRTFAIGPLVFELARTADLSGTLTIRRDARTVHTDPFERQLMEGADPAPIDLAEGGPGIPTPVAAWTIADGGPILVVVMQPGYEGVNLKALLVDATSTRAVDAMTTYFYHCAF